jgi:3-oxoacyl-[acyl-carrier-protein] synthase II
VSASRVVAWGAVSPHGLGAAALAVPGEGEAAVFPGGPVPAYADRGVRRPTAALVAALPRDAFGFLDHALSSCLASLDAAIPGWASLRVGLALGTSSGGMAGAERLFEGLERERVSGGRALPDEAVLDATYGGGTVRAGQILTRRLERGGGALTRHTSVLVACASSTVAIGLGHLWLAQNTCDLVLVGGYDGLTLFVAAGFSCLSAVTADRPRPFRLDRDGLALSEGAGVVALMRAVDAGPTAGVDVRGFGLSSDAVHGTAPDRTGSGVARGAAHALRQAGLSARELDLVNVHGTATPFNDAAEARALTLLGTLEAHALVPVHAPKGALGHALGAAGVLEALAAIEAIERGLLPATAGDGPFDPDARVPLLARSTRGSVRQVLKLSAAFGGANASLVLSHSDAPPAAPPSAASSSGLLEWTADEARVVVEAREATAADLAAALGVSLDRANRLDELARSVTLAAWLVLGERARGDGHHVALIVETRHATVGRNHLYFKRILERSAAAAEPRRFPGTSPNFAGGEASILLGLRGPVLTVGGDPRLPPQGRAIAEDLVRGGYASLCVLVRVDEWSEAAERIETACSSGSAPLVSRAEASLLRRVPASD